MKLKCPNCKEYFDTQSAVDTTISSLDSSGLMDFLDKHFGDEDPDLTDLKTWIAEENDNG